VTRRKYVSEFGLNMFCDYLVLLQEDQLDRIQEVLDPPLPEFHIYIISRRPRISLDCSSLKFSENTVSGQYCVQRGRTPEYHGFKTNNYLGTARVRVECPYPYTEFRIFSESGEVLSQGKVAVLLSQFVRPHGGLFDLEVLYIGQAFGQDGKRTAPDRLKAHSTLQNIYAEASRLSPDQEIWITLCSFQPILLASFDGRSKEFDTTDAEDEEHMRHVLKATVTDQQKMNFTEAALIRYFQPEYNKTYKDTFPNPAHSTYSQCYDLDLNLVHVELETEIIRSRLWSQSVKPQWAHFCEFPLHSREQRRSMFDIL
jgi:hypothetical protein